MFRCKECQAEYEVKPDYCDCGNDTFDEILPEKTVEQAPKSKIVETPVLTPKEKVKRLTSTGVDTYAIIIFALCVLMSFVVIFFIGNPKPEEQSEVLEEIQVQKNIPQIDTFWDNTPVKASEPTPVEQIKNIVENIVPKVVPPTPKPAQTKSVQKPAQQKPVQKKTIQAKPVQQKPSAQTQTQVTPKQNIQLPKSVTDITNKPVQQTVNKPQPQTVKPQTVAPVVKKLDQTEYVKYKNSLMTRIASKINFAGVIGDGSCIVSFSISSNGALINRKFEKQSENSTLNDAVYHAIMQTPTFNPPPAGYKGETIRLNVKMFNGTFEVAIN